MNKILRALVSITFVHLASQPSRADGAHHQGGTATVRGGQIQAQPWDDPAGSWRLRLFLSSHDSQASYNADGQHVPNPSSGRFSNNSLNAFDEYALASRWSVSALTSFQKIENRHDATKESWSAQALEASASGSIQRRFRTRPGPPSHHLAASLKETPCST